MICDVFAKVCRSPLLLLGTVMSWAIAPLPLWAETVQFQLLHLNDVYEITPIAGGTIGGLARLATLRHQLREENAQTFTVLAGDLLSPSALGTAVVNGDRLAGKHIVDVMNQAGLDLATFGNHEFDLSETQFQQRLSESEFQWFSGNVLTATGEPWENVPPYVIKTIYGEAGTPVQVGFVGVTIPSNPANYVTYLNPREQMTKLVAELAPKTDVIVAVTHLAIQDDHYLAENIPEIDLILGGHEHENIQQWRGADFTPIFKADANARTVYIHHLSYDTETEQLTIQSRLQPITEAIAPDPAIEQVVNHWQQLAFDGFRANGFEPEQIVTESPIALDGLESSVRNQGTALTEIIAQSMLTATPTAELAFFNGGSIRVDDVLPPGPISQYDVIRILPFGGNLATVDIKGQTLERILNQGLANQGTGGYLQMAGVTLIPDAQTWQIGDRPLDPQRIYRVAATEFLISGREVGLDFLTPDHPDVTLIETGEDVRFAFIQQLQQQWAD
ncbi:bifunctional UDP-sugar hydrolase/5'-nucleotidase [Picosynechococcus sp. NKBG15041c]|uniref:bifunctional metallophosphatase/5'-nucleotidase n=1 Tax=Picosynechococcus sp. NKBG15041c TaxID=1407650 RepID=UPI0004293C8D|nr:bifunctional metallophosphatase/5'-nucleotidase [Picosynechococcus sp. NKBG15041c]